MSDAGFRSQADGENHFHREAFHFPPAPDPGFSVEFDLPGNPGVTRWGTVNFSIREAAFEDLPDVSRIHVQSWRETYQGQVPQEYLDGMSVSARQQRWEKLFRGGVGEDKNLYVARDEGEAVGFISFGRGRDARRPGTGEIYAVYLLKRCWGLGLGYRLFETAISKLRGEGMTSLYLWVLDSNVRAIAAYERWGGRVDEGMSLKGRIGGLEITEIMVNFELEDR